MARNFLIDHILTDYCRLLGPQLGTFLSDDPDVAPTKDVPTESGKYHDVLGGFASAPPEGDRSGLVLTDDEMLPRHISVDVTTADGWNVQPTALGVRLNYEKIRKARREGLDLRAAKVAVLTRVRKAWRDLELANLLFSTTTFSGRNATPANLWDTDAGDPVADMLFARSEIVKSSGEMLDGLIVGFEVHEALQNSAKIKSYIKYEFGSAAAGPLSEDLMRRAFGLRFYKVGTAPYNAGLPGTPAASNSFIWGKHALFVKNRRVSSPMTPQSCVQRWRMRPGGQDADRAIGDGQVRRYPLTGGYLEQIDLLNNDEFSVPTPELGYLFTNVVS